MILIEHAVVVTLDPARRILRDGSVLVDGPRILQVDVSDAVRPPRPPERVIDGRGRLVLPGFVDTHVHLSEHLSRGLIPDEVPVNRYVPDWYVPLYAAITPEEEAAAAQLASLEMLRSGTTTFCEAGTLFDVPAVARAVEEVGLRAVLGRWSWDLGRGPGRLAQSTAEALRLTEDAMVRVNGQGSGRVSSWPLLIGFGTGSEALIRGAQALSARQARAQALRERG
jgi:5-methylthioadenosine/S-adenosylhomocysteine deaminase